MPQLYSLKSFAHLQLHPFPTRRSSDVFADDESDDADAVAFESNTRFTGRITGLPWYADEGRSYLHLGIGGSVINPENDTVRYRTRPEAHLAPRYVDTGTFSADMAYLA